MHVTFATDYPVIAVMHHVILGLIRAFSWVEPQRVFIHLNSVHLQSLYQFGDNLSHQVCQISNTNLWSFFLPFQNRPWNALPSVVSCRPELKQEWKTIDCLYWRECFSLLSDMKPYIHVLTPRTRGFRLLATEMRDYLDAVYDTTVVYAEDNGRPLDGRIRVPQMTSTLY